MSAHHKAAVLANSGVKQNTPVLVVRWLMLQFTLRWWPGNQIDFSSDLTGKIEILVSHICRREVIQFCLSNILDIPRLLLPSSHCVLSSAVGAV